MINNNDWGVSSCTKYYNIFQFLLVFYTTPEMITGLTIEQKLKLYKKTQSYMQKVVVNAIFVLPLNSILNKQLVASHFQTPNYNLVFNI